MLILFRFVGLLNVLLTLNCLATELGKLIVTVELEETIMEYYIFI